MSIPNEGAGVDVHVGAIVGFRGYRCYVREVRGSRVLLHWQEERPARRCRDCQGTGELRVLEHTDRYTRDCPRCKGTGELPAGTYPREATAPISALKEAPPRDGADPVLVAKAADLYRKAGSR